MSPEIDKEMFSFLVLFFSTIASIAFFCNPVSLMCGSGLTIVDYVSDCLFSSCDVFCLSQLYMIGPAYGFIGSQVNRFHNSRKCALFRVSADVLCGMRMMNL